MVEATALVSLGMFVAFIWLFYGPWQDVCTDAARQLMFERRDALFDLARAGKLDFTSNEYRDARKTVESMIRYAHELTWISLYFSYRRYRQLSQTIPRDHYIDSISDTDTRDKVKSLLDECVGILVGMMAAKSIFAAPIAAFAGVYSMFTHGLSALVRRVGRDPRWSDPIKWGANCCN